MNTSAHSQEAIWSMFCSATKSRDCWPVFRRLECAVHSCTLEACFVRKRRQAICFWNQTYHANFYQYPSGNEALSNTNTSVCAWVRVRTHTHIHVYTHTCTHTLSKNTSSLTIYSCSPINKEMNHTETNSNAGVIRPDLAPLMMVRESLYLGQMSSPTSTTCVLMQKQTKDKEILCFPPSLACALSNTQWQVLGLWRGVGGSWGTEESCKSNHGTCVSHQEIHYHPEFSSKFRKIVCGTEQL